MGQETIRVDDRDFVVDTDPLPGGGANFQTHGLVVPREGELVLRPSRGFRIVALILILVGCAPLAIAGTMWSAHGRDTGVLILLGFGLLFSVSGLLMFILPRRHTFDIEKQLWTAHGPLGRSTRPLTDILAVQLIEGGWHTTRSGPNHTPSSYFTYQLNLILDDDGTPRRNLLNHGHWDSIWQTSDRLADFLGVPFQDLVSEAEDDG
jgi:hypothetical protein